MLEHDLCLVIEALARTTPAVPVETIAEPVLTLEQISKRLNVSTKTITRWRDRGLVSRKVLANGRRQVGFVQSVVDRFLATHRDHVRAQRAVFAADGGGAGGDRAPGRPAVPGCAAAP